LQIEDIDVKTWQHFIAVNLSGAFFLAKAGCADPFANSAGGRIINVTTKLISRMLNPGFSTLRAGKRPGLGSLVCEPRR